MYITNTRPYICFDVNTLSQYLVKPRRVHLIAVKHVMRYLRGTIYLGLYYGRDHDYRLYGYTDLDWAGSVANEKEHLRWMLLSRIRHDLMVYQEQSSVSLSTAEAEYIAACSASCESIWIQKLMSGLFDMELDTTVILCDNQSCVKMTDNPLFHDKSKHIEIWYFI